MSLSSINQVRCNYIVRCLAIMLLSSNALAGFAQSLRAGVISGVVLDRKTDAAVPFASIALLQIPAQGTVADSSGTFHLETNHREGSLRVTAVGYTPATISFGQDGNSELVVYMDSEISDLDEFTVKARKPKYRNKDNPAVVFIRKVIANKEQNQASNLPAYFREKYEKVNLSLSLKEDATGKHRILQKFPNLLSRTDSISHPDRSIVPVYLVEKSLVDLKVDGQSPRTIVKAVSQSRVDQFLDEDGLDGFIDKIYGEPDVYNHDIALGNRRFLSPLAESGPMFYEYYLQDTLKTSAPWQLRVMVKPRNEQDGLFTGHMFVTLDEKYSVTEAVLKIGNKANVNWLDNIIITMHYIPDADQRYYLSRSTMALDMGIFKDGIEIFGEKTITSSALRSAEGFKGVQVPYRESKNIPVNPDSIRGSETLSFADSAALKNVEYLKSSDSFKKSMALGAFILSGYKKMGLVDLGPVATFYSFNPIEGSRIKIGGRTNELFGKRFVIDGYAAYGTRDRRFKYSLAGTLSLNQRSIYEFPAHTVSLRYTQDLQTPGQELVYSSLDNFLLSFVRGTNNKMWYSKKLQLEYFYETPNHVSWRMGISGQRMEGAGVLKFEPNMPESPRHQNIHTTEAYGEFRWAPNETFFQGKRYRRPIDKGQPVFTVRTAVGFKGIAGGQYSYTRVYASAKKRFFLSQYGHLDVLAETGAVFGKLPYPLLSIHRANQTYAYQHNAYNLMNFAEFLSDRYAGINVQHSFNGFILNKVPLVKRLKLREHVSVKALWGSLSEKNDPARSSGLFKFPVEDSGNKITYGLGNSPYLECGLGFSNIFKVLRIDLVRRVTYLNHSQVSPWGIRAKLNIDF